MSLFLRITGEQEKIGVHSLNAAIRRAVHGSSLVDQNHVIARFEFIGKALDDFNELVTLYQSEPSSIAKLRRLQIIEDANILAEEGEYNESQWRSEIYGAYNMEPELWSAVGGKIGIGTTDPKAPLEIVGDLPGNTGGFSGGILQVRNPGTNVNDSAGITLHNSNNGNRQLAFIGSASSGNEDIVFLNRRNGKLWFGTNGLTVLTLSAPGNVGIGTASPAAKLHVNGSLYVEGTGLGNFPLEMGSGANVTVGGVWTNASSRAYKKNIRSLTQKGALRILDALTPVAFEYRAGGEKHLGFIAEDVPEEVASPGRKGLSPMDIVAVLVKGFQAQAERIAELEKQLKVT